MLHVNISKYDEKPTRDIMMVQGIEGKNDTLYFFMNHWPSRRGGTKESDPKRAIVAQVLRSAVDSLMMVHPQAKIIIMGDFNTYNEPRLLDGNNSESIAQTKGTRRTHPFMQLTGIGGTTAGGSPLDQIHVNIEKMRDASDLKRGKAGTSNTSSEGTRIVSTQILQRAQGEIISYHGTFRGKGNGP